MAERYHRPLPTLTQKQVNRFHSRVQRGQPDECWPWLRGCFDDGYGAFKIKKQMMRTNRVAYFIATNVDPADQQVCHTCDNPPCCNPAHLFLGDTRDNIMVRNIRSTYAAGGISQSEIARRYGLNSETIRMIIMRRTWKHVA